MEGKRLSVVIAALFSVSLLYAQVPSQLEQIRLQVWADLDPFPGSFENLSAEDESVQNIQDLKSESILKGEDAELNNKEKEFYQIFGFAINRTKEVAPFLLSGMIYGWNFEYTPYDKKRQVSEYWDFIPIKQINSEINKIEYKSPVAMENRLVCWVYCDRTFEQVKEFEHWNSIVYPRIHGIGQGPVEDGFEGIKKACSEAAKEAVREYWRTLVKNKPKEISGKLLLIKNPRIFIKNGQYTVDLDFFMETDRIISYTYY